MTVLDADFRFICDLVRDRSAMSLGPGKEYLAMSRLTPVAHRAGLATISDLVSSMRTNVYSPLRDAVVEALTTNETSFFRDVYPFESLRTDILPETITRNSEHRTITIWSAGCATGQEPYSIAMMIRQHFPELSSWNVTILASDISKDALKKAREGSFDQMEVNRGLPAASLLRHFDRDGSRWRIKDSVRELVTFEHRNLIDYTPPLTIDILFLRNVLIYFAPFAREAVLTRLPRVLKPQGVVTVGSAETTMMNRDEFEPRTVGKCVWYRKSATGSREFGEPQTRR